MQIKMLIMTMLRHSERLVPRDAEYTCKPVTITATPTCTHVKRKYSDMAMEGGMLSHKTSHKVLTTFNIYRPVTCVILRYLTVRKMSPTLVSNYQGTCQ